MAGGIPTTNLQVPTVPQPTATPYNRQQQIGLALSALSDVLGKRDPIAGTMQRHAFLQAQKQKEEQQKLLQELAKYINNTYGQHYASDKYQATDVIIDSGHGEGFALGNIMKYAKRYGNKEGKNRKDLLKILHYAIIMLYVHDTENT